MYQQLSLCHGTLQKVHLAAYLTVCLTDVRPFHRVSQTSR